MNVLVKRKNKFCAFGCSPQKIGRVGENLFFYFAFLYHDTPCNITQQIIKNNKQIP